MKTAALESQKSALKNFRIAKAYRRQMIGVPDVREVLRYRHYLWQVIILVTSYRFSYGSV